MIIRSTSTGSASVGNSSGAITGSVIVERYVPARRAWRLMTAPLSNANTIYDSWQNGGVNTPGMGTFITGPGGDNGLDVSKSYSLKTYNVTSQLLTPVTNTNVSLSSADGSADNKGYFLFVRGDRDPANLTPPNSNVTTLSANGSLQTGKQTFTASGVANNFTLVGNPYAAPVDFNSVTRTNVPKKFWAWDPNLNTVGGYVLLDDQDGDGNYSVSVATSQTNVLQSGQAFFVQTTNTEPALIEFNESSKSPVTNSAGFRGNNGSTEVLRTSLYLKNKDNSETLADGVLSEYNSKYSEEVNIQDGSKMENINENLAIQRNGHLLSIERRPLVENDTLYLNLTNTTSRDYRFRFDPSNISSEVSAWLEDTYLNTSTPLSMITSTDVDFSITAGTASAKADRFRIVFKLGSTLPVTFTTIKGYEKGSGIQVDWSVATESNIRQYEIERSADGQVFSTIGTVVATSNNAAAANYYWLDEDIMAGNNFYRIKAVEKSGEVKYSQVVSVNTGNTKRDIVVYPNPVSDGTLKVRLNNQPKGKYTVELFNGLGQKVFITTIVHAGGSVNQSVRLPSIVSKGIYQLEVKNGETRKTQQLIIE